MVTALVKYFVRLVIIRYSSQIKQLLEIKPNSSSGLGQIRFGERTQAKVKIYRQKNDRLKKTITFNRLFYFGLAWYETHRQKN